jgi:serine/threonine-protein kinase
MGPVLLGTSFKAEPQVADLREQLQSGLADRYRLERELGRGGMARVYLASDLRHRRFVALKVLHPHLSQTLGPDRFQREIEIAARLQHPHILPLHDSGETAGQLWYTMPYVEGESLRDKLRRETQLGLEDALRLAAEVGDALEYAHSQAVIHRDIKPENILLSRGHALIADFGIARALSQDGEQLTLTGVGVGTPAYMSPEQAGGQHEAVDARADLYSLACVLYEMLAGEPPYTGPTARAILTKRLLEPAPDIRMARPNVPARVADGVARALAPIPGDRFISVGEFIRALQSDSASPTQQASHPIARFTGRGRPRMLIAAAALVLSIGALWYWRRPAMESVNGKMAVALEHQRIAVLYFQAVGSDPDLPYVADGLTQGLIDSLRYIRPLEVVSSGGVAAYRTSTRPLSNIAAELGVSTLIEGKVDKVGGIFRVTVWLVQGSTGVATSPRTLEGSRAELLPIQGELARVVVTLLRDKPVRPGTRADAWILVQRAQERMDRASQLTRVDSAIAAERELQAGDSLLTVAEQLDEHWVTPVLRRGQLAYRWSRIAFSGVQNPRIAIPRIEQAVSFANRALTLKPKDPDALELRGTARYWRWLIGAEKDSAKASALLADAQRDLETSVSVNVNQAGAWAVLSHLYNQTESEDEAATAAEKAYEADPYLSNSDQVLSRLFLATYDLARFADAARWCELGLHRFPTDSKFVSCRLWLMTSSVSAPDVSLAWKLADSIVQLARSQDQPFERLKARMAVAAVLARSGLADSARHVVERSRGNPDVDPTDDLRYIEAFVHVLLKDRTEAIDALKSYLAVNPDRRTTLADDPGWWFEDLKDDSRFKELVGTPTR